MEKKDIKKDILIKLAIIIGIIVAVNIISNRVFTRLDLSKNKSYTLSNISKVIVGDLGDKLEVRAYFSDNLPSPYNNLKRDVKDLLSDYRSYSKGNLNYVFVNEGSADESNAEFENDAQKFGIQPVQIQVMDNDKLEVKKALMGLVISYQGKSEVIPFIQSVNNLEYDITSKIKKIITEKKKKIGFLTGHGEYDYTKWQTIHQTLMSQYDVTSVDLSRNIPVPNDIDVLLVAGPKSEFPEWHKFQIDQYIMRGGNVAFMINKVIPNFQQQIAIGDPVDNKLDDMLFSYGIKIDNDLIRDLQCSAVSVQTQIGIPMQVSYPYFPMVSNINRDISAFKNIQAIALSFVSSLDLQAAQGKDIQVSPLLTTSDRSGKATGFFILNLEQFQNLTKQAADTLFNQKGFVVGALYSGNFKSFYADKPAPSDTISASADVTKQERFNESKKPGRIIAIGDGDFAHEEQRPPKDNITFFVNMVDFLADDVGLAEIRSKDTSESPIEDTSDGTKRFVKYFNLIFPPLLIILFGAYIWNKRKINRKKLQS